MKDIVLYIIIYDMIDFLNSADRLSEQEISEATLWASERLSAVQEIKNEIIKKLIGEGTYERAQMIERFFEEFFGSVNTNKDSVELRDIEDGEKIREILVSTPEDEEQNNMKLIIEYLIQEYCGPDYTNISFLKDRETFRVLGETLRNIEYNEEPDTAAFFAADNFLDKHLILQLYIKEAKLQDEEHLEITLSSEDFDVDFDDVIVGRNVYISIHNGRLLLNQKPVETKADLEIVEKTLQPLEQIAASLIVEQDRPELIQLLQAKFSEARL